MIKDIKLEMQMLDLLPEVHSVGRLKDKTNEELLQLASISDFNPGDILYCEEENIIVQFQGIDFETDENIILEDYKTLFPTLFETNENVTANIFIPEYNKYRERIKKVMETSESNNIGFYAQYLNEQVKRDDITEKEKIELKRKQKALVDSVEFFFIKNSNKLPKFDNKLYKKYRQEARKKLKENNTYTFAPINEREMLNSLNYATNNNPKNKLFLLYFYKYITECKLNTYNSLVIHFSILNILDLPKPNNKMREYLITKISEVIKDL